MARARLSRDVIVRVAVEIADAQGFDALRMRGVATALGVTPMALYRHLPDKSALVDVVVDESLRAVPIVDPTSPMLSEVQRCFEGLYDLLLAHPGLARAVSERSLEGPVATRIGDQVLTLLGRNGIPGDAAANLLVSLFSLTLGSALYRTSRSRHGHHTFSGIGDEAPTVWGVRNRLEAASADSEVFRDGLVRLIRGYAIPARISGAN